jgi:hypothetical protein
MALGDISVYPACSNSDERGLLTIEPCLYCCGVWFLPVMRLLMPLRDVVHCKHSETKFVLETGVHYVAGHRHSSSLS